MGQVSRNYWATVSPEEKRERARKSAQARWDSYIGLTTNGLPKSYSRIVASDEVRPLIGGRAHLRPIEPLIRFGIGRTIQNPDRICLELDGELLHYVLDVFLAVGNRDRAIVLEGAEFALHEDVSALHRRGAIWAKAFRTPDVVPLRFVFPLALVVLPGPSRCDGELDERVPFAVVWSRRCGRRIR